MRITFDVSIVTVQGYMRTYQKIRKTTYFDTFKRIVDTILKIYSFSEWHFLKNQCPFPADRVLRSQKLYSDIKGHEIKYIIIIW